MTAISCAEAKALEAIRKLDDPVKLRTIMTNARAKGADAVASAAFSKLCNVQPAAKLGTVGHEVWQSIFALEEMLKLERGKTIQLSRTRQKIGRDGELKTVADLTMKPEASDGFHQLVKLGHPELLFESVVLRHPASFDESVRQAALDRLNNAGVDIERVTTRYRG